MMVDSCCYSYAGKEIVREMTLLQDKIKAREWLLNEALLQHRLLLGRCSPCCKYVSVEITFFFAICLISTFFEIYDYIFMPWSQWHLLADFTFKAIFMPWFRNRLWAPINTLSYNLMIHVAEAVAGVSEGELWNVTDRSHFLHYLNCVESRSQVYFFGKLMGTQVRSSRGRKSDKPWKRLQLQHRFWVPILTLCLTS